MTSDRREFEASRWLGIVPSPILGTEYRNRSAENKDRTRIRPIDPGEPFPTLPVETLRDWYVTVCGGWSPDLRLNQIGINRQALERNTSLNPAIDRVRVTVLGHVRRPILMDSYFEIVPLDPIHPDALRRSPSGEAVFPEGDEVLRPDQAPLRGESVLLNNVVRRLDLLPSSEEFARILHDVLQRDLQSEWPNS